MDLSQRASIPLVKVDLCLDSNGASEISGTHVLDSTFEQLSVPAVPETKQAQEIQDFNGDLGATVTPLSDEDLEQDVDTTIGGSLRDCGILHVDGGKFWPTEILHQVLTIERICEELDAFALLHSSHDRTSNHRDLASLIMDGYCKIFALLCLLSKSGCIRDCIQENVRDSDLPFISTSRDCKLSRSGTPRQNLRCFQKSSISGVHWPVHEREQILSHQERFSPVVFGLDTNGYAQHIDLSSEAILPFVRPTYHSNPEHGGFATVDQVSVHPSCHRFRDILPSINTHDLFARKMLNTYPNHTEEQQRQGFETEVGILNRFSALKHGHLVKLLASWTKRRNHSREYCLLFPLANGDLDWYWTSRKIADTNVRWISKQVLGLSDALRKIHDSPLELLKPVDQRRYGRHGDLKPENILWYNSPEDAHGILVIADMGASAVNSLWSRSAVQNRSIQHTPRYKPPECDLKGGKISRSYDIWTFGCILLELVCWCLQGQIGREEFESERYAPYPTGAQSDMFFDIKPAPNGRYVVLVKEGVTKKLASLHHHPSCTLYFHELLYLIEEEMIVAVSETKNRITSAKLYEFVALMEAKMDKEPDYYRRACAMPRRVVTLPPVEAIFQSHRVEQIQDRVQGLEVHTGPTQRTKSVQELVHMELE